MGDLTGLHILLSCRTFPHRSLWKGRGWLSCLSVLFPDGEMATLAGRVSVRLGTLSCCRSWSSEGAVMCRLRTQVVSGHRGARSHREAACRAHNLPLADPSSQLSLAFFFFFKIWVNFSSSASSPYH